MWLAVIVVVVVMMLMVMVGGPTANPVLSHRGAAAAAGVDDPDAAAMGRGAETPRLLNIARETCGVFSAGRSNVTRGKGGRQECGLQTERSVRCMLRSWLSGGAQHRLLNKSNEPSSSSVFGRDESYPSGFFLEGDTALAHTGDAE